jgi:hypothetical protein
MAKWENDPTLVAQEKQDVEQLKAASMDLKLKCYDMMKDMLRYSPQDLLHSGYRNMTIPEALMARLMRCELDIQKLTKAFLKKWPDD